MTDEKDRAPHQRAEHHDEAHPPRRKAERLVEMQPSELREDVSASSSESAAHFGHSATRAFDSQVATPAESSERTRPYASDSASSRATDRPRSRRRPS